MNDCVFVFGVEELDGDGDISTDRQTMLPFNRTRFVLQYTHGHSQLQSAIVLLPDSKRLCSRDDVKELRAPYIHTEDIIGVRRSKTLAAARCWDAPNCIRRENSSSTGETMFRKGSYRVRMFISVPNCLRFKSI